MRTCAILLTLASGLLLGADDPEKEDPEKEDPKKIEKEDPKKIEEAEKEAARKEWELLQKVLAAREDQVLEAWRQGDAVPLQRLLAEEYRQVGGPGPEQMDKKEVIKSLVNLRIADYEKADRVAQRLGPDSVLLTYRLRLKGSFKGSEFPPNPILVSSTWALRGIEWVSVFRQLTLAAAREATPEVIDAFEAIVTDSALRCEYKGTAPLTDVQAMFTFALGSGQLSVRHYWATWQPGEVKLVGLEFLAPRPSAIQRIDLQATATAGDRRVLLSRVWRESGCGLRRV